MKFYDADAGNTRRVRILIMEKSISIPTQHLILGTDTRAPWFKKLNSLCEVPVLELDDGSVITDSIAICRYLDRTFPDNCLTGGTVLEQAKIEMWSQRIFLEIFLPVGLIVRHTLPLFADKVEQVPEFAETQKRELPKKWHWLDQEISDGRPFLTGEKFTFADIQGMTALKLTDLFDLSPPENFEFVSSWADRLRQRPSWEA